MKQQNAYLKDESLLTLFSLSNMIVPEIQREYVWGNHPEVLEPFLKDLRDNPDLCQECHHVHTAGNKTINVGFLYSYKPPYVAYEHERILDEYLIDGQQRITTLFLLLLYRAAVEDRVGDFMAICRINDNVADMGFNYKVRALTQRFVHQLVLHVEEKGKTAFDFIYTDGNGALSLDCAPTWLLDDFRSDATVMSMLRALNSIKKVFNDDKAIYFDYLLHTVHFWHFKTEATSQGEELYITMNARGVQLSDNEMQKAKMFRESDIVEHGEQWEKWQTFFWRNRKKGFPEGSNGNENADKGLNNFLACVQSLEWFHGFTTQGEQPSMEHVARYFEALELVCDKSFYNRAQSKNPYFSVWYDKFLFALWREINTSKSSWEIVNPEGKGEEGRKTYRNQSGARNNSMLFWPWMIYYSKAKAQDEMIDEEVLVRLIHFYYIRFNCFKRSTTSVERIVDLFIKTSGDISNIANEEDENEEDNGAARLFSEEEIGLSSFISSNLPEHRKPIEALIWEIQEIPYFLDGKDVGGDTIWSLVNPVHEIIHLECLEDNLKAFKDNMTMLLPNDIGSEHILIKELLLFYKDSRNLAFWKQQSPWYYQNYETSSWKRIVRTENFLSFYKDFASLQNMNTDSALENLLSNKRKEFFISLTSLEDLSPRKISIIYDYLLDGNLWDKEHENIVFSNRNENDVSESFQRWYTLWHGRRYYDSSAQITLPTNWHEKLAAATSAPIPSYK